jgi:hypothetical protein
MPTLNDVPSTNNGENIVFIESHSQAVKLLLDLVTGGIVDTHELVYGLLDEVLAIGDRYQFTDLPRLVLPIMHHLADENCWYVFEFAAKNDFMPLAKYALDRFASDIDYRLLEVDNMSASMLDGIPGKYVLPLIRNMTLYRTDRGATDWTKVVYHFPICRRVGLSGIGSANQ